MAQKTQVSTQASWIWYPGDFEIYHCMTRHTRRQVKDSRVPAFWRVSRPELACTFETTCSLTKSQTIHVYSHGQGRVLLDFFNLGNLNEDLTIPAGSHTITVNIYNRETFPSIFVNAKGFETGKQWKVHCYDKQWCSPDCEPSYLRPEDDPAVFPFCYKKLKPVAVETISGGTLYDFGVETFGPVTIAQKKAMGKVYVSYGESRFEALDWNETIVREMLPAKNGKSKLEPRAFRFLFVSSEAGQPEVSAQLEYLPLPDAASFTCDRPLMNQVWDICLRTIHINSREFYLDGPKQDGWIWAGDAYHAYTAGRYLFQDQAITKRTLRAMFGRLPVRQHINTINDYSSYQIISLWEYYFASGDLEFVRSVWEETKALYSFMVSRLEDGTGYMIGREGDWIFIDWSVIDKTDPNSTEQILLWQVHRVMGWLAEALGEPMPETARRAARLKKNILRDFWKPELGAFICTPTTGKNMVTRHANIMAILYDFVDEHQKEQICQKVLFNQKVVPITTPFFKLFELLAISKVGHVLEAQSFMEEYWGGMVNLGATTVWEQFDASEKGLAHYAMYGQKFGRSLCHVWGSGPIAVLGMYVAGIRPTSVGGKTFVVEPQPGMFQSFDATFPVAGGLVRVCLKEQSLQVTSSVEGGTLRFNGKSYPILPKETLKIKMNTSKKK